MSLRYASDRVPGRRAANRVRIPLNSAHAAHDVEEIAVEVIVGEDRLEKRFPTTESSYTHTWEPAAEAKPQGASQVATVRVGTVHRAIWPRPERVDWQEHQVAVGLWDARRQGLGGWTLTPHHALDTVAGIVYLGHGSRRQVGPLGPPSADGWRIPSDDAAELYEFNADGSHRRTLDSLTGGERFVFVIDADGRLEAAGPPEAELCRVQRQGAGITLLAPGGAATTLTLDEAGFLRSVVDPAGARIELQHGPTGLLSAVVDPRGNSYRFSYDELGRLTSEELPDGGGSVLTRTPTANGFSVRRSTATGLELVNGVERLPGGVTRRVTECCGGGGQVTSVEQPDGSRLFSYPDGSTLEVLEQPDPRFGASVPALRKLVRTMPAGLSGEIVITGESMTPGDDGAAPATRADTLAINGRAFLVQVDAVARRATHTTAAGRTAAATFDDRGALSSVEGPRFPPLRVLRDPVGRSIGADDGLRRTAIRRDHRGRPVEIEYSPGRVTRCEFDEAERVVRSVSPGSRSRSFEYDAAGNMTAFTTPNGAVHRFEYGPANRWTAYEPPTGARYEAGCDADGRPTLSRSPSGREVRMEYDDIGRLRAVRSPEADVTLQVDTAGRLTGAARMATDGSGVQELAVGHDGPLVTSVAWHGPATATVRYTYDADFRIASIELDGGAARRLARDPDGFITANGPFSMSCDGPGGAASSISDERMAIAYEFDASGRIAGRTHRVAGSEFYRIRIGREPGRGVRDRDEMIDGATISRAYTSDDDGQLVQVDVNGSVRERYVYDLNGNRTEQQTPEGSASASFDAADRLIALGEATREVDVDGFLMRRGDLAFAYGARGELLRVLTDGTSEVQYTYDGLGRLVARTDLRGSAQYVHDHLAPFPRLLASRSPDGVVTEYFFDNYGDLFALLRGGAWFYVACDEVGSPRVVVDADGHTVKTIDRDVFGVVLADTDPSFELCIGFAGGLEDPHTGLVRFGLRDYELGAGRWTAPDPIGFAGGSNLYRYCWNNPVSLRDPAGTQEPGTGSPIWPEPYRHVYPWEPQFHPEPTPIDDPAFPFDTGPPQWDNPRTDTFPIAPPTPGIAEKFAGSEPTPGGEPIDPGWNWRSSPQNYGYRGAWCQWQVGVGGIGVPGSPYSPMFPGAEPGSPEPGPGDGGGSLEIRF